MKNAPIPSPRTVCITILLAALALAPAASGQSTPSFDKSFAPATIVLMKFS